MRILIDIGHPAHVHYFRSFIKIMETKGHNFLIIARDKEVTFKLLNAYNLTFFPRGKGGKGLIGKFTYLIKGDFIIYKLAKKFKPDIFLSFASPYAAHVSKLLRKPHISFTDTEHALLGQLAFFPFTDTVLTPSSFFKDLGAKQIRFNSYMELCYLHPNYFTPNPSILSLLGVNKGEKYVIMRFVSWNAAHDVGHSGLSVEMKHKAVKELSKYVKVFISSEGELPEILKQYQIQIPPEKMHDLLSFASLYVGEGATTASECAVLGTPAIYVNVLDVGYLQEQERLGLLFNFRDSKGVLEKAIELINDQNILKMWQKRRMQMLSEKIDITAFMVWFIENYPASLRIMKENPEYQNNFK